MEMMWEDPIGSTRGGTNPLTQQGAWEKRASAMDGAEVLDPPAPAWGWLLAGS